MFLLATLHKFTYLLPVMAVAVLCLAGCGFDKGNSVFQKENGVVFCVDSGVSGLDPLTSEVNVTSVTLAKNTFNRLVDYDRTSDVFKPEIARTWTVSQDLRSYRFFLNTDVTFHKVPWFNPTRNLNADDVIFTFTRLMDYANPYEVFQFNQENSGMVDTTFDVLDYRHLLQLKRFVKKIVKIDDYTVEFILNRPSPYFLEIVSNTSCVILSKEFYDSIQSYKKEEFFKNHLVGTGPFKQEDYQFNNYISLIVNQNYWQKNHQPRLSKLILDITPNRAKRMNKIMTGECQVASRPSNSGRLHKKFQQDFSALGSDSVNSTMLFFNTARGPMSSIKIRQKVKELLNRAIYNNILYSDSGKIPSTYFPFDTAIKVNLNNKERLRGKTNVMQEMKRFRRNRSVLTVYVEKSNSKLGYNSSRLGQMIASDIKSLGLKVRIINADLRAIKKAVAQGNYDIILFREQFPVLLPLVKFSHFFDCQDDKPSATNYSSFCHHELITMLDEIQYHRKESIDIAIFEKINRILSAHIPFVPIAFSGDVFLYNNQVAGLKKTVNNGLDFTGAYLK